MKSMTQFVQEFNALWLEAERSLENGELFNSILESFEKNANFIDSHAYLDVKNKYGIYVFYIKPFKSYTLSALINDWKENGYSNYPKVAQSRFQLCLPVDPSKEYVFYIGKAENIGNRLKEHITHRDKTSTYSLKLAGRTFFSQENIKYSYWTLPEEFYEAKKEVRQFIMTQIELKLRDQLNPWIGKQ